MELEGVVQNGVIVPQGGAALPEGAKVRILAKGDGAAVEPAKTTGETVGERLNRWADRFQSESHNLPADYSVNFEHYLFGTPKRS